eukprot:CAMPEP_0202444180 /NCGR_PEP_ID=MMETSP1360-20130828/3324_1 /ASSEMBLY_ACC=CAM_ASM_000848 /TAXON_ID=515479 /ORGANISM="Licmophora paradoxa, Strain CCMP2313" /LENGTH=400 /DNA_ID=CAMNT_0049060113 /DNA_START=59 /DNA_END=1261 /DNA_ORIENTATION=-
MAYYGRKEYWDERYKASLDQYDWYQSYHGIRHLLTPLHLSASCGLDPNKPRRHHHPQQQLQLQQQQLLHSGTPTTTISSHNIYPVPDILDTNHPTKFSLLRQDCRVLIVGCGNSRLPEWMVADGWTGGIVGLDWSSVVIEQMKCRYHDKCVEGLLGNAAAAAAVAAAAVHEKDGYSNRRKKGKRGKKKKKKKKKGADTMSCESNDDEDNGNDTAPFKLLDFVCADICDQNAMNDLFADNVFDLIICKGMMDAMLSGAGSIMDVQLMMNTCYRLLDHGGAILVVTHGNPESRVKFFELQTNNNSMVKQCREQQQQQQEEEKKEHGANDEEENKMMNTKEKDHDTPPLAVWESVGIHTLSRFSGGSGGMDRARKMLLSQQQATATPAAAANKYYYAYIGRKA